MEFLVYQRAWKHWDARLGLQRAYAGDFANIKKEERRISSEIWTAPRKAEAMGPYPLIGMPATPNIVTKFADRFLASEDFKGRRGSRNAWLTT